MSGHCEHCDLDMCGKYPLPTRGNIHGSKYAQWTGGHCPACAEHNRIARESIERATGATVLPQQVEFLLGADADRSRAKWMTEGVKVERAHIVEWLRRQPNLTTVVDLDADVRAQVPNVDADDFADAIESGHAG